MAAAARTTKHIIQAYRAVRQVETLTQAKLDALLETNALYKLFDPDTRHPYYVLASDGQKTLAAFEELIAGVLDWTVDAGTIGEEWKAGAEANKILGHAPFRSEGSVPIDGICVRVGAMRCHSQAVTVKLTRDLPMNEIESLIAVS